MLGVTRKAMIKDILLEKKSVIVSDLAKRFDVTEETIRRDLQQLENEGFLTRTYGGAFIQEGAINDVDLALREAVSIDKKEAIAEVCASLIHHGDTIFLDASTTASFVARAIKNMRVTVLTNSLMVVDQLKDHDSVRLICLGGVYSPRTKAFNGRSTILGLNDYYVDKAFISCRYVSLSHGITDSNEDIAMVRQTVLNQAHEIFLIADSSKFNKTSFMHLCDLKDLNGGIISDFDFTPDWERALSEEKVNIYRA
ncbi:MAG: DeoR/GlpR transcriptional regulator [Lachnospiraceae bacterium]|nr:DeoR/GlpR transcriptional regulator [Candidatus Equihabitans merdae]